MISDRYILKPNRENFDKILNISEHMAACYGFEAKELLLIRLLTEEMISSVQKGLMLVPGELWFSTNGDMFIITVSISTDIFSISDDERKKLIKSVKSDKKPGLFGLVSDFFGYLAEAEEEVSLLTYVGSQYGGYLGASHSVNADTWQMDGKSWLTPGTTSDDELSESSFEINLLKGFADDIQVTSKLKTLEMSVMKRIPSEFSLYFLSTKML